MTQPREGHQSAAKACASGTSFRDTIKLRGRPKAGGYEAAARKGAVARVMTSGTVTTPPDATVDNPQPSPKGPQGSRVQFND